MSDTLSKFKELLQEQLGTDDATVTLESRLAEDLGADSLDHVEITIAAEVEFEIEISDEDAERLLTVGDWIKHIDSHAK